MIEAETDITIQKILTFKNYIHYTLKNKLHIYALKGIKKINKGTLVQNLKREEK